jgi:hypothetical protein
MIASIEALEREKQELEEKNAQSIQTNRELLDQLEQLNTNAAESDAHIQALEDTLRSTEQELERLSTLAARTQYLERQLIDLEKEQLQLQRNLDAKLVDERTAVQRWKNAERTITDLQDQIDRIEKEAREERKRHLDVVGRMERRMAVDSELNTAAGRLKAKAGLDKNGGTNVVSHFVKDILLDNANLQHGIMELRGMLDNSNGEVERLRDQLKVHQPVSASPSNEVAIPNLQKELEQEQEHALKQALHIHHHYHGPKISKTTPKAPVQRRPKKKRFSLAPSHFDPPPVLDRSNTASILNHTAVSVPNSHRWSQASTLAPESFSGSPVSHRGSMYDRVFSEAYDSSRPTSPPDSIDFHSPMFGPKSDYSSDADPHPMMRRSSGTLEVSHQKPRHLRRDSRNLRPPGLAALRSTSTPTVLTTKSSPASAVISAVSPANSLCNFSLSPSLQPEPQAAIPEECEDSSLSSPDPSAVTSPDEFNADELVSPMTVMRPQLRRHASHESLISVSGMDIHTLASRPSQLLYSSSPRLTTPRSAGSVGPELTPWTATAHGTLSNKTSESSMANREFLYSSIANSKRGLRKSDGPQPASSSITQKVGGWVFGKWGATPAPASPETTRPSSILSQETQSSASTAQDDSKKNTPKDAAGKPKLRPSGVNQNGPIWGFFDDVPEAPAKVVVQDYDADALGEALAEQV